MTTYDLWMTKFGDLPPLKQVAIMVGMAIAASDLLTVLFFLVVRLDRLDVALIVTTIIVIIVSVPLGAFLVGLTIVSSKPP